MDTAALSVVTEGSLRAIAGDAIRLLVTATGNANTADAYRRDLADFLAFFSGHDVSPGAVEEILGMARPALIRTLTGYRSDLQERGLAASTTNRRLATVSGNVHCERSGTCCGAAGSQQSKCSCHSVAALHRTSG